jgi:hypothetical protein
MASYDSKSTEEPGQYPAPAFARFGLPAQTFGSGAPGGSPTSSEVDAGDTNEPGQYPNRETFTGVALNGTGAPGGPSVGPNDVSGGPDTVTFTKPTFYKGIYEVVNDQASWDEPGGGGYKEEVAHDHTSGPADWTQANDYSYGPGFNMPGVEGNTPTPGSGQFQTGGAGQVLYGGYLNGNRPGTGSHPSHSGPGT